MKSLVRRPMVLIGLIALCALQSIPIHAAGASTVYDDSLASGWQNWSWDTSANFNNSSPVHGGGSSLAATYTSAWGGLYLDSSAPLSAASFDAIQFWIDGGASGGQKIVFRVVLGSSGNWNNSIAVAPVANTWTQVTVPLASIGNPATFDGLVWQDNAGGAQPTFFLDDISLVAAPTPTPTALALAVNASSNRHPISPYIYGMNFADATLAAELKLPVDRYGGNATTRYNWENDTANRASDWYFENIPNDNAYPAQLPNGSQSDQFVDQDRSTGTRTIMTAPLIGWTPKSRAVACGFSVGKYGSQQAVDPYDTDCGNGVKTAGGDVTGNDPTDTSVAIDQTFVAAWMRHLIGRYGTAANGGVEFFDLDNEAMLWNSTHRDVHPNPTTYDEMRNLTYQYAPAMKAVDASAQILGPVEWGWSAYFDSALDSTTNGADRQAHGNLPYVAWYLQQMHAYETANGTRILDYLDLHFYPQADGVSLGTAGNASTQALRLRSTRALWDPTYADESWIAQTSDGPYVDLIPRMRDWVNTYYPGTKISLSEYNWGGLESINGALAEADVLGIFGRESLDLAAIWAPPTSSQPGAYAFRIYRNYDGAGSEFGDESVSATSTDQSQLAIYAAQRTTDDALTIVVINKTTGDLQASVGLNGFTPGPKAQVYRYSSSNLGAIVRQPDLGVSASGFAATYPASSISLFVLPVGSGGGTPVPGTEYLPFLER